MERIPGSIETTGPVLGIDIGGTKTDLALAGRDGVIVARTRIATAAEQGPDLAMRRIEQAASSLLVAHPMGSLRAIGVVGPGVIHPDRILLAPNLPGWEHIGLADRISQLFSLGAVAATNDVKAAALAEARYGALLGCEPGLYLNLGTGLGAAIVIGGQVMPGRHQAAGEIAYIAPGGSTSAAGDNLEDVSGGKSLLRRAEGYLGAPIDAAALFAATDPQTRRIVDQALDTLAIAVANMAVLLDPDRIVVGGGMMASADVVLPALLAKLNQLVPFPPDLKPAYFTQDAALHGAIALALEAAPAAYDADSSGGPTIRPSEVNASTLPNALRLDLSVGDPPRLKEHRA